MADETVKKLLIKLGISTTEWKTAVNDIKRQLNDVNEQAKKDAAQMKATQKEQIDLTRQQIADQKRLVAEAKTLQAVDQAKSAWQKQHQEAIKTAVQQQILQTAEARKQAVLQSNAVRMAQDQVRLEQQKLRLAEQQRSIHERHLRSQAGGDKGGGGGILGSVAGAIFGGGPIGMIAGGVAGGEILTKSFEMIAEKLREVVKEMINATGSAGQLREQFEKLAVRAGVGPEDFLNKLRVATRGLVEDNTQLIRVANQFMSGPLKLQPSQIEHLMGVTVALARATARGPDSVETAMQALSRTAITGRVQMLAMSAGLTGLRQELQGVGRGMNAVAKEQVQLAVVTDAMMRRYAEVGTPLTTLKDLFSQVKMVEGAFIEDTAYSVTHTKSLSDGIGNLSAWLMKVTPQILDFASSIGEKLGNAITRAEPLVKGLYNLFKDTVDALNKLINALDSAGDSLVKFGAKTDQTKEKFTLFRGYIYAMTKVVNGFDVAVQAAASSVELLQTIISKPAKASEALEKWKKDLQEIGSNYRKTSKDAEHKIFGAPDSGQVDVGSAGKSNLPTQDDINVARQKAMLELAIKTDKIKAEMALEEEKINIEKAKNKELYDAGLETLEQYLAKERTLIAAQHKVKLDEIDAIKRAKLDELALESKGMTYQDSEGKKITVPGMAPALVTLRQNKIIQEAATSTAQENLRNTTAGFGPDKEKQADQVAAYRTFQEAMVKIASEGVQDRIKLLEEEYKEGIVDADDYLKQKETLINDELKATQDGLQLKREAAKKNAAEEAKLDAEDIEAQRKANEQLSQLDMKRFAIRAQYADKLYNDQKKELETRVSIAAGDTSGGSISEQRTTTGQLRELAMQHIVNLNQQMNDPNLQAGSDAWKTIKEQIQLATLALQKYTHELNQMHNISGPLGGIFGAASGVLGAIPRSKTASSWSETFGNMQQSSSNLGKFSDAANAPGVGGGMGLVDNLEKSFTKLFKSTDPLADRLDKFGKGLSGVISGVMGVIQGVTSGKTGAQGALGGASAGAQFGQQFSAVPVIGPFAGLIGGVAGGVMGGIFGSKEKQLQQDIHKVTTQLNSIVADLQAGTISMSQALQDLRHERQAAIALLQQGSVGKKGGKGGGKGGKKGYQPSQAQAVIQQIDSQITQLVDQQATVLQSLTTSLMQLSNPLQYQDYLQSLDQIIQKYQQFASAAQGNAQMMGEANQYLNDSLNQYVVTLSQQLNQAQQTAINDALTLINLEYQRQQIINQEAQQEYDILTQGVITRQRTNAMTKGQEIGVLRYQRDMQLQQINEQISLQQYKVATETQIFGLATTRIGLETQLLEAQTAQAQFQMQQVMALSQVVSALTSGLSGGALMTQITSLMSSGAMPTESGIMYTLLTMLGLAGNVPTGVTQGPYGTTNWLAAIPSTDASAAQYVAALDPNFMNMILNQQYKAAASDAQQYITQGEVDGYDMTGLVSWLNSMPSKAEGGTVQKTGPELLHQGEFVLSNPMIKALNAVTSVFTGGNKNQPVSSSTSTVDLSTHKTLYDLTQKRTSMEMTVITARQSQIQSEMQLLGMYQDTFSSIASGNSSTSGLEDMVQKVWENRGRYGGANFRRQSI
jgi:hypothetical protein